MKDRKTDEPVGYVYNADVYCDVCVMAMLVRRQETERRLVYASKETAWEWLQIAAKEIGVDIEHEDTYDSGDFPKPVWAWMEGVGNEHCGLCREPLIDPPSLADGWGSKGRFLP